LDARLHGSYRANRVEQLFRETYNMSTIKKIELAVLALFAVMMAASMPAAAQPQQKPNILFIMGDDIGWMQPSIYHQGIMVGETPNIDRIGQEGARFMTY